MPVGEGFDLPVGAEPWSDFHWFQASCRRELVLVVLCERPLWYTGHYSGSRMMPCTTPDCAGCEAGLGAQVRYVFACADRTTHRVGLLELSKGNAQMLEDWIGRASGLRGMVIEVSKHSKSPQSRTELRFVDDVPDPWFVALEVPDAGLALFLTWHKAGFAMPADFVDASRRKMELKRLVLEDKLKKKKVFDDAESWTESEQRLGREVSERELRERFPG